MAYESSNETRPHIPVTSVCVSPLLSSDNVAFSYLKRLIISTYRPVVEPVVLMGRYESRGESIEKFRASVVGWSLADDPAVETFLIPPQEGTDRHSALMAVIRLVEDKAHKRMADLEGKDAGVI